MTRDEGVMSMDLFKEIINQGIKNGLRWASLLGKVGMSGRTKITFE
jgi:hypothetical protein